VHQVPLYSCCYLCYAEYLVDWTGQDRTAGRYQSWRACMRRTNVPINRPHGAKCQPNGLDCVSAGSYDTEDMCDIEDCDICLYRSLVYNGQPALPFLPVFRSRSKTRQSTKAEQSAQGTFIIIMAANKLKLKLEVKVKVEQKSLFSRLTQPAPCLSSVMVCFGNVFRSDLRFCTLWRRTEGVEMSIALMITS